MKLTMTVLKSVMELEDVDNCCRSSTSYHVFTWIINFNNFVDQIVKS